MRVDQVLSGAGPVDAVTVQALRFQELFRTWGWEGEVHAAHIDPRVGRRVRPLADLAAVPGATILVHYSAYAPKLARVLDLPQRKVLLSHNVTPARWFWDHEPTVAIHCALGRRQLPEFAARCDVVAGVSAYNARELGGDRVVPILMDFDGLGAASAEEPAGPPELLFVGRWTPHKRQDELIRLIALLRRHRVPDARLRLVGEPLHPRFEARLRELAEAIAPGAVVFESGLSGEELAARFRGASVLVCLSEHEGFCVPVLEAFHHGVPVVARPVGGVPEVAGDAALLVEDRDLAVVAEAVALVLEDGALRAELRARGRERLRAFAPERVAAALRELLEA